MDYRLKGIYWYLMKSYDKMDTTTDLWDKNSMVKRYFIDLKIEVQGDNGP